MGALNVSHHFCKALLERDQRLWAQRIEKRLCYASPEEACRATFAGGPVALAYARFTDDVKSEAHAEYLASIESFWDGTAYSIPGEILVAAGKKPTCFASHLHVEE